MEDKDKSNPIKIFDTTLKERQEKGTTLLYEETNRVEQKGMTFQSVAEQLNSMILKFSGGSDSITLDLDCVDWPEAAIPATKSLMFNLRKIYIIPKPDKKPEFGIWLEIRNKENLEPTELIDELRFPVRIEALYLKIWNTSNEIILKEMKAL